jgi:hypothetical protein
LFLFCWSFVSWLWFPKALLSLDLLDLLDLFGGDVLFLCDFFVFGTWISGIWLWFPKARLSVLLYSIFATPFSVKGCMAGFSTIWIAATTGKSVIFGNLFGIKVSIFSGMLAISALSALMVLA